MKRIIRCCFFILIVGGCKSTETDREPNQAKKTPETRATPVQHPKPELTKPGGDTLLVTQTALIIHQASQTEIQKWKNENPESFGESLSDNLTYLDEAQTHAKKKHISIIQTDANYISFANNGGSPVVWGRGTEFTGWGAIAFKENGTPVTLEITSSSEAINKYFK